MPSPSPPLLLPFSSPSPFLLLLLLLLILPLPSSTHRSCRVGEAIGKGVPTRLCVVGAVRVDQPTTHHRIKRERAAEKDDDFTDEEDEDHLRVTGEWGRAARRHTAAGRSGGHRGGGSGGVRLLRLLRLRLVAAHQAFLHLALELGVGKGQVEPDEAERVGRYCSGSDARCSRGRSRRIPPW